MRVVRSCVLLASAITIVVPLLCAVSSAPTAVAGDAGDVDEQIVRLTGSDAKAANAASDALVAMGAKAVAPLVAALGSNPVPTRVELLKALGRIGADHDEAIAPLVTALADGDPVVREAAAHGLFLAGARSKSATADLRKALVDRFVRVRVAAAGALMRAGESPFAPLAVLTDGLKDGDVEVRVATVGVLGELDPAQAGVGALLVEALKSDQPVVVLAAIEAVLRLPTKPSEIVAAVCRSTTAVDPKVRRAALDAVAKLVDRPMAEAIHFGGALRGDRIQRTQLAKLGGDRQTEWAVAAALDWLARHQSPNGAWEATGFQKQCAPAKCSGTSPCFQYDPGLTGLALLAFLGAGETHLAGPHKDNVARGLKYLRGLQDSEGCIGGRRDSHFLYNHAIATIAVCETYMLTRDATIRDTAQNAVTFVHKAKNPYLAWRYNWPPDGDNDTSSTGWMAYATAVARASCLEVEPADLKDAAGWVDKMTETSDQFAPSYGRVGYQERGGTSVRTEGRESSFPRDKAEPLTSIGVMVRLFAGRTPKDDPLLIAGERVLRLHPTWDPSAGTIDFYHWFWGSMAMRQLGGQAGRDWKQGWKAWSDALKSALLPNQHTDGDGCVRGSWDPVDAWSDIGGRVYSTSMCCMCLESYYRMDSFLDGK